MPSKHTILFSRFPDLKGDSQSQFNFGPRIGTAEQGACYN